MLHTRDEVIKRTIQEFELLDNLVANLAPQEWELLVPRPEAKDPWTVKDALAHITYWKANMVRSIRRQRRPDEERGLSTNDANHLIFKRWHDRPSHEVLTWHRKVQQDLLTSLRAAPDEWFSRKDHNPDWPYDLDGHSANHRIKDIQRTVAPRNSP